MDNAQDGISAAYASIFRHVHDTYTLREALIRKFIAQRVASLPWYQRWLRWFGIVPTTMVATRLMGNQYLLGKLDDASKAGLAALATDTERESPGYTSAISPYWIESLAAECCSMFSLTAWRVKALGEIHALVAEPSPWQRLTSPQRFFVGVGVGIVAFAALVPKEAFSVFGLGSDEYGYFFAGLALAIAGIALYLTWRAVADRTAREYRRAASVMAMVITYCAIVCDQSPNDTLRCQCDGAATTHAPIPPNHDPANTPPPDPGAPSPQSPTGVLDSG
jgi:hypothetical protein